MTPAQILGAFSIAAMLVTLARDVRNARSKEGARWKASAFIAVLLLALNGGAEVVKRRADANSAERQTQRDRDERQFRLELATSVAALQSTLSERFRQHEPELKNLPPAANAEIRSRNQELQQRLADLANQIEILGADGAASSGEIRALVTEIGGSIQQFNVALQYVSTIRPAAPRTYPEPPLSSAAPRSGGFAVIGRAPPSLAIPETKVATPPLIITVPTPSPDIETSPVGGVWAGSIEFDQGTAPVTVTIDNSGSSGRVDSRGLGLSQVPIGVTFRGGYLSFDLRGVDLSVNATLTSEEASIDGTVSRLDFEAPIRLRRTPPPSAVERNGFSPMIGSVRLVCATYGSSTLVPSILDLGTSGFGELRGYPTPAIVFNPVALSKLSRAAQLLWYGHQCAHFAVPLRNDTPEFELLADCWAFVMAQWQGVVRPEEVGAVVPELMRLYKGPTEHLPTGSRALMLPDCRRFLSLFTPISTPYVPYLR